MALLFECSNNISLYNLAQGLNNLSALDVQQQLSAATPNNDARWA